MTGARVYRAALALLTVALAGCGAGPERPTLAPPATPRTIQLDWVERLQPAGLTFRVDRLVVGEDGWRASVSMTNRSRSQYRVGRDAVGLVLLETGTRRELERLTEELVRIPPSISPDTVTPRPPTILRPGASWRGELSGAVVLRSGSFVRVLFGPFSRVGARDREASDVHWVTDHTVRI
jgi:hypothetical protein